MRIQLPFADTPVIKRNKEMRKASAENGQRRSSSGMRGRRASSLIDEGRGNGELNTESLSRVVADTVSTAPSTGLSRKISCAVQRTHSNTESEDGGSGLSTSPSSDEIKALLRDAANSSPSAKRSANHDAPLPALPHSEVPAAEFYKHISAELTEPRRMRCLLGWCGTRTLPPKLEAPKAKTSASNDEFQALQAGMLYDLLFDGAEADICVARVIQEELSQDLITKGILSDWFSRDDDATPQVPLRKKPNPRNVANAAKAEELESELERYGFEISDGIGRSMLTDIQTEKGASRVGQSHLLRRTSNIDTRNGCYRRSLTPAPQTPRQPSASDSGAAAGIHLELHGTRRDPAAHAQHFAEP